MRKLSLFFLIMFLLNLGNLLDISTSPKKSDIIVVLGGGGDVRIKRGVDLYKKDFSSSNKFLYTGSNLHHNSTIFFLKSAYLLENGISVKDIIYIENVTNTMEELVKIKEYLIKNNLKKVLFVSHPTHLRRIQVLANVLLHYDDLGIKSSFVSADHTKVWNKNFYFLELESIKLAFLETIKIFYNLLKYAILL